MMRFPAHMSLRRLFSSKSVKRFPLDSLLSVKNKNPSPSARSFLNISSVLESIECLMPDTRLSARSKSTRQNISSLESFLHYVTPFDVSSLSSLNLNPSFDRTVSCYASLLHVLTSHGVECHVAKIIFLMTKMCDPVLDRDIALVGCCCKLQKYGEAVKIVEDIIRYGHSPPFEYCKMLVCRLFDRGDKEKAESVIQKMIRSGFYDDEVACENWLDLGEK